MFTVTISIGRGLPTGGDMDDAQWDAFIDGVRRVCQHHGVVFVDAARSVGEWDGVPEESATFVVGEVRRPRALSDDAAGLGVLYGQEAVAVTTGTTALV